MRIATTASPVSGADVRERIHLLRLSTKVKRALEVVSFAWQKYRQRKQDEALHRVGLATTNRQSKFRSSMRQQSKE